MTFKQFTAYEPMHTTTTSTTLTMQVVNPKCYGCAHSCVMYGKLVCYCQSRTMSRTPHGDACMSYAKRTYAHAERLRGEGGAE